MCYYWPVFFSLSLTISSKDLISGQPRIDGNLNSSVDYLTGHIYHARRVPKKQLMNELQAELDLSDQDMYQHFYQKDKLN